MARRENTSTELQVSTLLRSSSSAALITSTDHPLLILTLAQSVTAMETAFRKIDIDALDEDVLLPQDLYDPDPRGHAGVMADAKARSGEVRSLVSK